MTEEDARQKWCPFARTFDGPIVAQKVAAVASVNRIGNEISIHCRCVAAECMAWRWDKLSAGEGHCGLAGDAVK